MHNSFIFIVLFVTLIFLPYLCSAFFSDSFDICFALFKFPVILIFEKQQNETKTYYTNYIRKGIFSPLHVETIVITRDILFE